MGVGSASVDPALTAIWAEVLGVEELDGDDDFFALGGNSLLATQITARVADALGVDVPLEALFEAPTLAAYAEQVRAAAPAAAAPRPAKNGRGGGLRWLRGGRRGGGGSGGSSGRESGGARSGEAAATGALSHLQESAWSVQHYNPGLRPHVGQVFSLQGLLDVPALEQALTTLVARHELLRTIFPLDGHRPRARVLPPEPVRVEVVTLPRGGREADVARHVDEAWNESFDPPTRPSLRVRLIRTGRQSHVFVFILHEMLCDGQAYDLLVRELSQLYRAALAGEPSPLPEPALQYREVLAAHGTRLAGGDRRSSPEHWRETLSGSPLALPLPFDAGDPPAATTGESYARRSVQLSAQLAGRLSALAQEEAATSFMLYLAALYALLHRYTGETDLLVRSPTANRARVEWEQVVGFFSIVLPLRVDAGGDPSFRALLRRTRVSSLAAFRNAAHTPEDNEVRAIDGLRGLNGWSVLFRLWDPTTEQPLELANLRAKPYRDEGEGGRLVLIVTERADGRTVAQLSSSAAELDARTLGEMLRHYERLLTAVAENPDQRIGSELELLSAAERAGRGAGAGARGGGSAGADSAGLHGLVEARARETPEAVAFDAGGANGESLTYGELDARAEQLACVLLARGIGAEAPVGLLLAPSADLLVAMIGALKAGAACVPLLDPGHADEPTAELPPLAGLVRRGGSSALPAGVAPPPVVVDLDADAPELAAAGGTGAAGDRTADVPPERLALVVRSAGVEGTPRAVELTHGALCHVAARQRDAQRLTGTDRVAQVPGRGAWSWALTVWPALAAGATIVSPARAPDARSATPPTGWLEANGVTVAAMGPGLASAALARPAALPGTLRLLLVQGAGALVVPDDAVGRGKLLVQRQYGLVEAGGTVLSERVTGSVVAGAPVVGEPVGARASVLDAHGNVVPPGVVGELCLEAVDGSVLHTGDLARRRADGAALEIFGRISDEVAYRGIRLNPIMRDVETALTAHPGVQAAAVCWEPAHAALVACVVPRRSVVPDARELDDWLQRTMDDWILPAHYATIDDVPVRPDGLPDRRALAAAPAVAHALAAHAASAAPQTRSERKLAAAWKKVLDQRDVGVHDNFFAVGGSLILGLELAGRAREEGVAVEPGLLMYRPSIAELAASADERG